MLLYLKVQDKDKKKLMMYWDELRNQNILTLNKQYSVLI